uniref:Uncharacterized protein n=1 Tax=Glossina brevipalpis TaxID=37001 RepID=A0A1A9W141_9MUSC
MNRRFSNNVWIPDRIRNQEPRTTNHGLRTTNHESGTTNQEPRITTQEPRSTNQETYHKFTALTPISNYEADVRKTELIKGPGVYSIKTFLIAQNHKF